MKNEIRWGRSALASAVGVAVMMGAAGARAEDRQNCPMMFKHQPNIMVAARKGAPSYGGVSVSAEKGYSLVAVIWPRQQASATADVCIVGSNDAEVCCSSGPGNKKKVRCNAPSEGSYRMKVKTESIEPVPVRASFDYFVGCEGVDTCFGAVGDNCLGAVFDKIPNLPVTLVPCTTQEDGMVECMVSVGSQMYDTCCSSVSRLGYMCNGTTGFPQCKEEWDHAVNDSAAKRQFSMRFDPTEVTYGPKALADTKVIGGKTTSAPRSDAFKIPKGYALWDVDAEQGWCATITFKRQSVAGVSWATCVASTDEGAEWPPGMAPPAASATSSASAQPAVYPPPTPTPTPTPYSPPPRPPSTTPGNAPIIPEPSTLLLGLTGLGALGAYMRRRRSAQSKPPRGDDE